jgi:O-antigen ligase
MFSSVFFLLCAARLLSNRIVRGIAFLGACATAPPLLLSGRRTAVIACAAGFAFLLLAMPKASAAKKAIVILLVVAVIFVVFQFALIPYVGDIPYISDMTQRFAAIGGQIAPEETEDSFLEVQLAGALRAFSEHPFIGIGVGTFSSSGYSPTDHELHNAYLQVLAEMGILGVAAFAAGVFAVASAASRCCWGTTVRPWLVPIGCFLLADMISGIHNIFYREREFWIALSLCSAELRNFRSAARYRFCSTSRVMPAQELR